MYKSYGSGKLRGFSYKPNANTMKRWKNENNANVAEQVAEAKAAANAAAAAAAPYFNSSSNNNNGEHNSEFFAHAKRKSRRSGSRKNTRRSGSRKTRSRR